MTAAYTAREGSIAARAIAHLQLQPAGTAMLAADLAEAIGVKTSNLSANLAPAVKHDVIERTGDGRRMFYALAGEPQPEPEPEPDGPLEINHDSSGDLWFTGHRQTEAGATLLSMQQLQQLVTYATTAPVRLQPASSANGGNV